jgi:hypothetical protein
VSDERSVEDVARRIEVAAESFDLSAYEELLDPDVTWGAPHAKAPGCKSRQQVLAWYRRGRDAGVQGRVSGVEIVGQCIVLGVVVKGTEEARERGGAALRWQVNTVRGGRVVEIVGFEDHLEAISYAETKSHT